MGQVLERTYSILKYKTDIQRRLLSKSCWLLNLFFLRDPKFGALIGISLRILDRSLVLKSEPVLAVPCVCSEEAPGTSQFKSCKNGYKKSIGGLGRISYIGAIRLI